VRGLLGDLNAERVTDPLVGASTGLSRRLDVMEVEMARLKRIARPLGVSMNDVVLTALAGTLGAYHRERRVHTDSLTCMVPMNLRTAGESGSLGNRVGVFSIHLPVAEKRVDRRLERIVKQTQAAKSDRRGALYPFFVQTLTTLPAAALRWLAQQSLGKVNVACTNVPGVTDRRYMAGARVEAIYPFAAVVQGTPLVMALFSYAGTMDIGFDTDPEAIPDPHRIAALFEAALEEVAAFGKRAPR
jgi:WS/DGAT/MGAT family acyltransferase